MAGEADVIFYQKKAGKEGEPTVIEASGDDAYHPVIHALEEVNRAHHLRYTTIPGIIGLPPQQAEDSKRDEGEVLQIELSIMDPTVLPWVEDALAQNGFQLASAEEDVTIG
jgi:hypothetical protein